MRTIMFSAISNNSEYGIVGNYPTVEEAVEIACTSHLFEAVILDTESRAGKKFAVIRKLRLPKVDPALDEFQEPKPDEEDANWFRMLDHDRIVNQAATIKSLLAEIKHQKLMRQNAENCIRNCQEREATTKLAMNQLAETLGKVVTERDALKVELTTMKEQPEKSELAYDKGRQDGFNAAREIYEHSSNCR